MNNIINIDQVNEVKNILSSDNKKIVFTNGCFDILHAGHVDYLNKAKALGDILIVGLNSDDSIRKIKGKNRPIIPEDERAYLLSNLKAVDYVVIFNEETPENLINRLIPDILIKGADWNLNNIIGKEVVEKNGGSVKTIEFVHQQSTSKIINTILEKCKD